MLSFKLSNSGAVSMVELAVSRHASRSYNCIPLRVTETEALLCSVHSLQSIH